MTRIITILKRRNRIQGNIDSKRSFTDRCVEAPKVKIAEGNRNAQATVNIFEKG